MFCKEKQGPCTLKSKSIKYSFNSKIVAFTTNTSGVNGSVVTPVSTSETCTSHAWYLAQILVFSMYRVYLVHCSQWYLIRITDMLIFTSLPSSYRAYIQVVVGICPIFQNKNLQRFKLDYQFWIYFCLK